MSPIPDSLSSDLNAVYKWKVRCRGMLLKFVWADYTYAEKDSFLQESARLKLDVLRLWAEELAYNAVRTTGARRVTEDDVAAIGLTLEWLLTALKRLHKVDSRLLRIPELAAMAVVLECNTVVWEFNARCLVPYRNQFTSGLVWVAPDAAYIHLVHKPLTGWAGAYPASFLSRWKTRTL